MGFVGEIYWRKPRRRQKVGQFSSKQTTFIVPFYKCCQYWICFFLVGEFKIDSSTGDLKLMKSLDHERAGHYSLVVNAKDHGIPMLSTNATVRVSVLDVNDMAPVFMPLNVTSVSEVRLGPSKIFVSL